MYQSSFKYKEDEIVLGEWDCRLCAVRSVDVANRCIDRFFGFGHGQDPQAVVEARELGIKEIIESHVGFELSESEAMRHYDIARKESIEHELRMSFRKESERLARKKQFYEAKMLLQVVPKITVEYPLVPVVSVLATEEGDGLPVTSGVYFVLYDEAIAYVGQSINIKQRATLKHEKIFEGDRVAWLEFPCSVVNFAEAYYIGVTCPPRNFGAFQKKHEERDSMICEEQNNV